MTEDISEKRACMDQMLNLFHKVMHRAMSLESEPKEFGTGIPLHRAEIHTIQAIGRDPGQNMQNLARTMGVTKGAVSQMVAKLIKKGLVRREKSQQDGREYCLFLTDLGWTGYHRHEEFHDHMYRVFLDHYATDLEGKMAAFQDTLSEFDEVLTLFETRVKDF